MARGVLTARDFQLARQLEWEKMTPAQLKAAREVWTTGAVIQDSYNRRVWRVKSFSATRRNGGDGKKFVYVTLVNDAGYPRFHCTCLHGLHSRFASCWHAKTVARIYRIMVDRKIKAGEPDYV